MTMKVCILAVVVGLSIPVQSVFGASQEEEARLLAAARMAFAKHDAKMLAAITYWEGVPDRLADGRRAIYARHVAGTATQFALSAYDPTSSDQRWKDQSGVPYRASLPVTKTLKITFALSGANAAKTFSMALTETTYPVGEKDGKLYLLQFLPAK